MENISAVPFEKDVLYRSNTSFSLLTSSLEISIPHIKPRYSIFDLLREIVEQRKNSKNENTVFDQLTKEVKAPPLRAPIFSFGFVISESSILAEPQGYLFRALKR